MHDLSKLTVEPKFVVVICGGSVAGSEAALVCAESGILAIVIEQNDRPYGKIEDGLPRWLEKLRFKEYVSIDSHLNRSGVLFIPRTKLGRDISLKTIREHWKPNALLLANGAWRDRPLPIDGIERFRNKGLVYQNPFVYWFNHEREADYRGPRYDIVDDMIVVGGGLASIDVAKIINLELYARALRMRGIEISIVEIHKRGIPETLRDHGIESAQLGIKGCCLYYRRRKQDMPLVDTDPEGTSEQKRKAEQVRVKLMDNVMKKFLVRFQPCHVPVGALVEGGRLVGLIFRRTEIRDGSIVQLDGTDYEVRAPTVVSSIGSIPETIEDIPQAGEFYAFADRETGTFNGIEGVFGLGNVLTGRGNLRESRDNARLVTHSMIKNYLGLEAATQPSFSAAMHARVHQAVTEIVEKAVENQQPLSEARLRTILGQVEKRWHEIGYRGDYQEWLEKRPPS